MERIGSGNSDHARGRRTREEEQPAGDSTFDESGTSKARSQLATLFTFDFGAVPATLVVTLAEHSHILIGSSDLPWNERNGTGEYLAGSTVTQFIFDYSPTLQLSRPGEQVTFSGLTGQHTIRIQTIAEGTARAKYPCLAPDPGSTLLLLGMGLVGLRTWRKRA